MSDQLCQPSVLSYAEARFATALVLLDGEIVDANRSTSDLLGEDSPARLWNRNLHEWFPNQSHLSKILDPAMPGLVQLECDLRRSDGETRTVMISACSLHAGQSSEPAKEIIFEDITERRQLELQLQQAQKMEALGRLAGGVAHDFNNLLMVIRGTCELIVLRHDPDEAIASRVQVIAKATEQGAQLTKQLLAFSRRQILQPAPVEINESLREFSKMLAHLIGEDIEIKLALAEEPLAIVIDSGQLNQVLLNIAVNARDAMPSGGSIVFRTSRCGVTAENASEHVSLLPGEYVVIAIEDTGCGMPANILAHIFEPFYTTKWQGTGLGLATAYGILKQSRGGIRVESTPGVGTTFVIYLPSTDQVQPTATETPMQLTTASTANILIVEDEEMVRKSTAEFLTFSGYKVRTACDGVEGLEVASNEPDMQLVITDIVMPRMRGTEMATELRRRMPNVSLLFMTGYTQLPVELSRFAGAAMLHKPFALAELSRSVRALLHARDSRQKQES